MSSLASALSAIDAARACARAWVIPAAMTESVPVGTEAFALSAAAVVLFGHVLAAVPLSKIGQNGGAGYCTVVLGYDNSRGEWSLLATACIFAPYALLLPLLPPAGVLLALAACGALACYYFAGMHASHPGGARAHRILREPQWADKAHHLDAGWRCAVAEESHRVTAALLKGCELTGEPAGRQIWHRPAAREGKASTGFNPQKNPNPSDALWREQRVDAWRAAGKSVPDASWQPRSIREAVRKAMAWYNVLQADDGHWAGDYGGPHFLMPGLVVVWYVTGRPAEMLSPDFQQAMAHYLRVHQQLDGGWGMHIESPSTMFGSCMCYIALRLLGVPRDDPAMVKGRVFIHVRARSAAAPRARVRTSVRGRSAADARTPRRAHAHWPRERAVVRWWHLHGLVGQAVHVPPRRDGLGGAPSDPARAVAATRLVPLPPGAALVPLPDGLPAHVLPLRQALRLPRRRDRPAHRLAPLGALLPGLRRRAVGEHA